MHYGLVAPSIQFFMYLLKIPNLDTAFYFMQIGSEEAEFWQCEVGRYREKDYQHTKLNHCSYIALLKVKHILSIHPIGY